MWSSEREFSAADWEERIGEMVEEDVDRIESWWPWEERWEIVSLILVFG